MNWFYGSLFAFLYVVVATAICRFLFGGNREEKR
jgi:fucose permease